MSCTSRSTWVLGCFGTIVKKRGVSGDLSGMARPVVQDGLPLNSICKSWRMCNSAVWDGPPLSRKKISIRLVLAHHSNCFLRFLRIGSEFGFRSLSRIRRSSPMVWEVYVRATIR
jgi:hypothetical protein